MQLHEKLENEFKKSEVFKKYEALGIITILTIVSLVINAIRLLKACQSPKGVALIIKAGGPLVKLYVRRNIYKKMLSINIPEDDAKILSHNIIDLIQSMPLEDLENLIETVFNQSSGEEDE